MNEVAEKPPALARYEIVKVGAKNYVVLDSRGRRYEGFTSRANAELFAFELTGDMDAANSQYIRMIQDRYNRLKSAKPREPRATQRMAKRRELLRAAGLVSVTIWVRSDEAPEIRARNREGEVRAKETGE